MFSKVHISPLAAFNTAYLSNKVCMYVIVQFPALSLSVFFFFLSSGITLPVKHRSASGFGVEMDNVEFEFVFHFNNYRNPCFCLLHVVQIKTFSFSVSSSFYRSLTM